MRVPALLVFAALLMLAPSVSATEAVHVDDEGRTMLYAHWPASVPQGMAEPIPFDEVFPEDEPNLSEGPVTPGANATGTAHTFTFQLQDFFGRTGPLGTLQLDPATPAIFHIDLSADQTPWPSPAGAPPVDVDTGIAPRVTVDVTLRHGNQTVGHGQATQDLVTAPAPAGTQVQHYAVPVAFNLSTLPAGTGLTMEVQLHQVDAQGQRVMQSLYNVHTGEAYPTAIALPVENQEALFLPDEADEPIKLEEVHTNLRGLEVQTFEAAPIAWSALAGAVAVVGVTGAKLGASLATLLPWRPF